MGRYIALLRGINVGGKNKVDMRDLTVLFEKNGFTEVSTYINSGNVLFSSRKTDGEVLVKECEALLAAEYPFKIAVAVISAEELRAALENAPVWWNSDPESKHNAIFVIPPATVEKIMEQVGAAKPEYEKVDYQGRVIFWSAPIKTFSKTRWSKIVGSSAYDRVTIRNANTALKLLELTKPESAK